MALNYAGARLEDLPLDVLDNCILNRLTFPQSVALERCSKFFRKLLLRAKEARMNRWLLFTVLRQDDVDEKYEDLLLLLHELEKKELKIYFWSYVENQEPANIEIMPSLLEGLRKYANHACPGNLLEVVLLFCCAPTLFSELNCDCYESRQSNIWYYGCKCTDEQPSSSYALAARTSEFRLLKRNFAESTLRSF